METFDPNDIGIANGNFFGLPYDVEDSMLVLLPVTWDATVSYGKGTAGGPEAMLNASLQIDLFDEKIPDVWKNRIATLPFDSGIETLNRSTRPVAEEIIDKLSHGASAADLGSEIERVNRASAILNDYVYSTSKKYIGQGKTVGVVGGEHSVPFGYIKALGEKFPDFGILHIDAHADLRRAYEGFEYSHASIMYNVLEKVPRVSKICQVGVRDFCSDEYDIMCGDGRVVSFTDRMLHRELFFGTSWDSVCSRIVETLPENVYVSFDIDGLSAEFAPNTGTPVPGGLSFNEADYLLEKLSSSGKRIIGFDLCEVAPGPDGEWDANVGSRVLFKLCLYSIASHKNMCQCHSK